MDNLVWGIPLLIFALMCPLMMVGMAVFVWFGARLGLRRHGEAAAGDGHGGHMICGPTMMDRGGGGRGSPEGKLVEGRPLGRSH